MKQVHLGSLVLMVLLCVRLFTQAQQTVATATNAVVPPLVNFSGVLTDVNGKPLTGMLGVTFYLYKDQQGGSPLWLETQNVQPDKTGHYSVLLGSTSSQGLPANLFASDEAHWLGVQVQGEEEQPRVLLVSAPYALKAGDADTVGGLPASAFVLARATGANGSAGGNPPSIGGSGAGSSIHDSKPPIGGSGMPNYVALWTSATNLGDSNITQDSFGQIHMLAPLSVTGAVTGSSFNIGVTPFAFGSVPDHDAFLGFAGNSTLTGINNTASGYLALSKLATGGANTANGFQALYSTTTGSNNTASGYQALSANTASDNTASGERALSANTTGSENTASGRHALQNNTTGSNNTADGSGALAANTTGIDNTASGNQALYSNAGNDNTASGNQALYSNTTGINNTASGNQTLYSNTSGNDNTASGTGVAGAALFHNTTGGLNVAAGAAALFYNNSGSYNVADGPAALYTNTTGTANTGVGNLAGKTADSSFLTGKNNTALGTGAAFSTGTLTNATAIGSNAEVAESNAMVLGSINGVNGQTANTSVGIGTTTPQAKLDVAGNNLQTLIGDPGCGPAYAGLGFVASGGFNSCENYALIGDSGGNVYINSGLSGTIYFRNQNGANLMTINPSGDVSIKGSLSKGSGSFKIDHPLDPANKYLYHSFVESPDMMNVYNGNVVTNRRGVATVILPDYFEALNRDFRYQLTVIGQFAQAIVATKIGNNCFVIRTSKPHVEVSWQVTGIRHDAYAEANRIQVEVEKPPQEQGHYLHPELFGALAEQAVGSNMPGSSTQAKGAPVSSLQALPLTAQYK